ncbi:MAG: thioredoxin family protein [Bacteroidales bacterium]|nr:thioredoxin family protein [Bacteroidales bacterium]
MKKIFLSLLLAVSGVFSYAQENLGPIKWISFEEAERLDSTEHRPFMIDVYTDWCGWCKRMMATTFQNQQLASYINQNFYCIRFDAETSDTIKFQGKEWVSDGRNNKLAIHLLGQRMSYPTIVYIDRDKNVAPIPGYMDIKSIEPILVYFSEDLSRTVGLEDFKDLYMYSFSDVYKDDIAKLTDSKIDTTGVINWLSFEELTEKYTKEKKPIMIDCYIDKKYRGYIPYVTMNSIVHEKTILKDKKICDYINQNYYPVRFEATTTDTIYWMDPLHQHPFTGQGNMMPNQFTMALMNNNFTFPAMFFFDKEGKFVSRTESFFSPEFWNVVLKYYATEAYKTLTFEQFYKKNNI